MEDHGSRINRREFLRMSLRMGGAVALASFLEGCSQARVVQETLRSPTGTSLIPTATQMLDQATSTAGEQSIRGETEPAPTATPTEAAAGDTARIAFVKTTDRAAGVLKALELLGSNPVGGKRVFVKPNFNSDDPAPGSTHPEVLRALVTALQASGAQAITVGDRSGMGDTRRVMENVGVFGLADELGFEAVVLDELGLEDWVMVQPPGSHWEKGFPMARPCLEADALVQTCCLKTHRYGGQFTMSLKNSVGMVAKRIPQENYNYMTELHNSPHQRRMIAEINAAYTPDLILMDGVEAFISGGPDRGERVRPEVILAGSDRVAIDAAGVALLRAFGCSTEVARGKIFEQEQIARAAALGLGVDAPDKIEFVTEDAESAAYSEKIKEILQAG